MVVAPPASFSVQPSAVTVSAGQTFTVGVAVAEAASLGGFEFNLKYDPSILDVQSVAVGPLPSGSSRSYSPLGPSIDPATGIVTFAAFSLGATPKGPGGAGTLAVVTIKAKAAGQSALDLGRAQLSDELGRAQQTGKITGGRVTVQ